MMTTKKRFVLFVQFEAERDREIALEGWEYPDLQQAAEAIYGKYCYNSAVEISGRCFVVTNSELLAFSEQHLPFTMGFAGINGHTAIKLNEKSPVKQALWVREMVLENEDEEDIVGWDGIFGTLKSVHEEIGDVREAIKDTEKDIAYMEAVEPEFTKISEADKKKLAAIHSTLTGIFGSLTDILSQERDGDNFAT